MLPAHLQRQLQTALAHHQAGRLEEADRLYRLVRAAQPANFDALHLSGAVAYQQGRYKEAVDLLSRALRLNARSAPCEMRLGLAYTALGQHAEGEKRLRQAVRSDPRLIDAWVGLAVTLRVQGKTAEAISCYERVAELQPNSASTHDQIGALKADTQGLAAGIPHFRRALALQSNYAPSWCNLGLALLSADEFTEALESFDRALRADPNLVQAQVGRALAFQQTYQLDEALAAYESVLAQQPQHHEARSGRLLTLNYRDDRDRSQLFEEHLAFGRAARSLEPRKVATPRDPDRRLRVAFLSPDLRAHSVAYFLEPLLRHLDRSQFEILLYHDHFKVDATSARLKELAHGWKNFVGQLNDVMDQAIQADAPDILIDLAGHTGLNRLPLLARRLAPVQISYLGYPNTTGLRTIDFRLVDSVTDPDEIDQRYHTERLVPFSRCAWTYAPPAAAPLPARMDGTITFGSFNNPAKLSPTCLRLWARLLAKVPGARLLLKGQGLHHPLVRSVMEKKLRDAGFDLARVELIGRTSQLVSHLELYHRVDVALDPFPYNGTTTTCEALWMGVPVVTLRGDRHVARVGASLLSSIGQPGWIAETAEAYIRIAAELIQARSRLASLRLSLRESLGQSSLLDHEGQAARFAQALRTCWRLGPSMNTTPGAEETEVVHSLARNS